MQNESVVLAMPPENIEKPNFNMEDFSKNSEAYYNQIKLELEAYKGKYVALDYQSKKYWVGETSSEALNKAKAEFPDKLFYLIQSGSKTPFSIQTLSRGNFFTGKSHDFNRSYR